MGKALGGIVQTLVDSLRSGKQTVLTTEGFLSRCRHYCGQGSVGVLWPILREHLFVSIPVG